MNLPAPLIVLFVIVATTALIALDRRRHASRSHFKATPRGAPTGGPRTVFVPRRCW